VRDVLGELNRSLGKLYASEGRPSIPPEQLLSALLLQVFYGIRSERQLMEQLNYNSVVPPYFPPCPHPQTCDARRPGICPSILPIKRGRRRETGGLVRVTEGDIVRPVPFRDSKS
jgi:hypothetical protein